MSVLVLGGTADGRLLADRLADAGRDPVTSLAGPGEGARPPAGRLRTGGFGGTAGLIRYLRSAGIAQVVDATHPFAATMTAHAAEACAACGIPLLRLQRPSWAWRPDAPAWRWVPGLAQARDAADEVGGPQSRVFLATGRHSLEPFLPWVDRYVLARMVKPPDVAVPASWEVLLARGPFAAASETALLRDRRIEVVVSKDSGGPAAAKLDAAATLGLPVVMVRRPPLPPGVPVVETVAVALAWLGVPG